MTSNLNWWRRTNIWMNQNYEVNFKIARNVWMRKKMLFFFMNAIQELTKIKAIIEHLILH